MTSENAVARQIVRPTEEAGCVEPVAATGFEPDGSPIGRLGYPGQGTATLSIPALRQGPLRDPRDRLRQMNLGRPHWQKHSSTAAQTMTPQAGSHCERRRWNLRLSLYRVTSCEQSRCPFVPDSLTSCSGNLKSSSNFPANIHRFTPAIPAFRVSGLPGPFPSKRNLLVRFQPVFAAFAPICDPATPIARTIIDQPAASSPIPPALLG